MLVHSLSAFIFCSRTLFIGAAPVHPLDHALSPNDRDDAARSTIDHVTLMRRLHKLADIAKSHPSTPQHLKAHARTILCVSTSPSQPALYARRSLIA